MSEPHRFSVLTETIDGVQLFSGQCSTCGWSGPQRSDHGTAEGDAEAHTITDTPE